jgi:hemoglobin-like flavoprotein
LQRLGGSQVFAEGLPMRDSPLFASFRRIRSTFAPKFYERFLAADPQIAALFSRTDIARQQELLSHGMMMLIDHDEGSSLSVLALTRLAQLHVRIGVRAWMYDVWIRSQLEVVRELDPMGDDALCAQWEAAMRKSTQRLLTLAPHEP